MFRNSEEIKKPTDRICDLSMKSRSYEGKLSKFDSQGEGVLSISFLRPVAAPMIRTQSHIPIPKGQFRVQQICRETIEPNKSLLCFVLFCFALLCFVLFC